METLGKYLSMTDSELEKIAKSQKYQKSRYAKAAGALAMGFASLFSGMAEAAQPKYVIPKMDVTVSCEGAQDTKYTNLKTGAAIDVPYGCDIILDSPKVVYDTNGKNPVKTDILIKDLDYNQPVLNLRPEPGKSSRVFPTTISTIDAPMAEGNYRLFVAAEPSPMKIAASATLKVTVVKPAKRSHESYEELVIHSRKESASRTRRRQTTARSKSRLNVMAGVTYGTLDYQVEDDPFKSGMGFLAQIEYEGKNANAWAGGRYLQMNGAQPYLSDTVRMNLSAWSIGAQGRQGPLMLGAELGRGETFWTRDRGHMMGNYGFPKSKTLHYSARAGLALGRFDDPTSIQAFVLYGNLIQEQAIDDLWYGDVITSSRKLNEKGVGLNARINDSLRFNFYKTEAEGKGVKLDNTQISGELSFAVGRHKAFRPFVKYTHQEQKETGPNAQTRSMKYGEAAAGVRMQLGRRHYR